MTITELIMNDHIYVKVFYLTKKRSNRWLGSSSNGFIVCEHPYRARHTKILYHGNDEHKAVKALIGE